MRASSHRSVWLLAAPALVIGGCNAIFGIDALSYDGHGRGGDTATTTSAGGGGQGGTSGSGVPAGGGGVGAAGAAGGSGGQGGQGGGVKTITVPCDVTPCDVTDGGHCCLPRPTAGGDASCLPAGGPCSWGDTIVSCNLSDDCDTGEVCCGHYNLNLQKYDDLVCETDCSGAYDFVLCDPNGDPNGCEAGETCESSSVLPSGYFVCRS